MMNHLLTSFALSSLLLAGAADAQPMDLDAVPVNAGTLEVTIAGSYLQGAGGIGGSMRSADLVSPGGGTEAALAYRISPHFGLGVYGTINGYSSLDATNRLRTASAGVAADWHLDPSAWASPWLSVGAGVTTLWAQRDTDDRRVVGIELMRARAGIELRLAPWFAVGPSVSLSAATYTAERNRMSGYQPIEDKQLSLTVSAGLQGRFDL